MARVAHERSLGELVGEYRYAGDVALTASGGHTHIGIDVFTSAALGPVMVVVGLAFVPFALIVAGIFMAVGVPLTYVLVRQIRAHQRHRRLRRVYQHTGGLVIVTADLQPRAISWGDITAYTYEVRHIDPQTAKRWLTPGVTMYHSYGLLTGDNVYYPIDNVFRDTGPIAVALAREVAPRLVAESEAMIGDGQELSFGDVRVGSEGIRDNRVTGTPSFLPWTEIARVDLSVGLRVFRRGERAPALQIDSAAPNQRWLLERLVERALRRALP